MGLVRTYEERKEQWIEKHLINFKAVAIAYANTLTNVNKERVLEVMTNEFFTTIFSNIARADTVAYLHQQGIDAFKKEKPKKLVNKLYQIEYFANEKNKIYRLLDERLKDFDLCEAVEEARKQELIRKKKEEGKKRFIKELDEAIGSVLEDKKEEYYIRCRHGISEQISRMFSDGIKVNFIESSSSREPQFKEISPFHAEDYFKVSDFWNEYTGSCEEYFSYGKNYYRELTYCDEFEHLHYEVLKDTIVPEVYELIPESLKLSFMEIYNKEMELDDTIDSILDTLYDYSVDFLSQTGEECLEHMLAFSELPSVFSVLQDVYYQQIGEREVKREAYISRLERKKEEERKKIEHIFASEYRITQNPHVRYVLHIGDTNTGKTFQAIERMKQAKTGLYLAPLRLLAFEIYDKLNKDKIPCSLKTGEEERLEPYARHMAATIEMFDEAERFEVIVIDEAQMIADPSRGFSWFKAIMHSFAREVHIIASKHTKELLENLLSGCQIEIHEYERETPLVVDSSLFDIEDVRVGDALICFSRNRVLQTASKIEREGKQVSIIYGSVAPETRKKQMERFIRGETTIIVATDAIGMGLNLPIQRIVFLENEKFDGVSRRQLSSQEIKQIAGRAGRKGVYDKGFVSFSSDVKTMQHLLSQSDQPLTEFTIAPTRTVLNRYLNDHDNLSELFVLWREFEQPKGMKKANLQQEEALYLAFCESQYENLFPPRELFDYLQMPFSCDIPEMKKQWLNTLYRISTNQSLPEPIVSDYSLEALELSYKSIGLHLLFLYRLKRYQETKYWEDQRSEIANQIFLLLKENVKQFAKRCAECDEELPWDHVFSKCEKCFHGFRRAYWYEYVDDEDDY